MNQREIARLVVLNRRCAYNAENKAAFRRLSMKLLRTLARELHFGKNDVDIHYNAGGIAASGDATLHSDQLYVTLNADGFSPGILLRTCQHRRDYTGGLNRWFSFDRLRDSGLEALVLYARQMLDQGRHGREPHLGTAR